MNDNKYSLADERARYDDIANAEYAAIRAQYRGGFISRLEADHLMNMAYMRWWDRQKELRLIAKEAISALDSV